MSAGGGGSVPGQAWFEIVRRPTPESFAEAFTTDVALDASVMASPIEGPNAIRRFFDATRQMFDNIAFNRESHGDGATFLEWKAVYKGEPMSGITILETDAQGLIRRVRTFYGPIHQAKRFSDDLFARLC